MHTDWNCFNTWTFGRGVQDDSFAGVVLSTDAQHPSWVHKLTNERRSERNDQNIHYFQLACSLGLCQLHKRKGRRFDREISNCGQQDDGRYYQWRAVQKTIGFKVSQNQEEKVINSGSGSIGMSLSFLSFLLFELHFSKHSQVLVFILKYNWIGFLWDVCLQAKNRFHLCLKLREPCPECLHLSGSVTLYANIKCPGANVLIGKTHTASTSGKSFPFSIFYRLGIWLKMTSQINSRQWIQ